MPKTEARKIDETSATATAAASVSKVQAFVSRRRAFFSYLLLALLGSGSGKSFEA